MVLLKRLLNNENPWVNMLDHPVKLGPSAIYIAESEYSVASRHKAVCEIVLIFHVTRALFLVS